MALHRNLQYYETLHATHLRHKIVKRGIQHSYNPYNKINEVEFFSHGRFDTYSKNLKDRFNEFFFSRHFRLILTPRKEVIHSKFKAYEVNANGEEINIHLGIDN